MKSSSTYSEFVEFLNEGKVCLFETDTVVGIGCRIMINNELNENINRIFELKQRSKSKTFPWLISSEKMLKEYIEKPNEYALRLIEEKWPGATTLIFQCRENVPEMFSVKVNEEKRSLGFRIPDCEELINAIDFISCPIATTSANISGKAPVFSIDEVNKKILEAVDFVYTKKFHKTKNDKPSEIISCLESEPKIIRK